MMAYATHFTKQICSYSMDPMSLSLNVLSTAHFMDYLEVSQLLKNPQVMYQKGDNFLGHKIFLSHPELSQIYSP